MILMMTDDEADLLIDILIDGSKYHYEMLEQYESLALSEKFKTEIEYHSKAMDLCSELIWEISSLKKEETE